MRNWNFFNVSFLLAITLAISQAGLIPTNPLVKTETKATVCPGFLQGDTAVPCWSLNGKCYCFSKTKRVIWAEADKFCREGGMTLLNLESKEEDQLINSHIKSTLELADDYYWISGRFSNNRWEWATNEPLTYTNWYPREPSHSQTGSFIYINYGFTSGIWFDEIGPSYILFICEPIPEATTTIPSKTIPAETTIPSTTTTIPSTTTTIPSTTTPAETTIPSTTTPAETTTLSTATETATEPENTEPNTSVQTTKATTEKEVSNETTEEIPTEATTEHIPTEETTEQVPTEATTEQVPTEATTEEAPAEATTEQIPTEATTEEVPTEARTEIPTEATTPVQEKETTEVPTQPTTVIPMESTTESPTQPTTVIPMESTTESPTQQTTVEASSTPTTSTTLKSTTVSQTSTSESTTSQTSPTPTNCPSYLQGNINVPCWTLTNGKCYCFSKIVRNWAGADSFCRGGGMNLIKLETAHENNLIYNHHTNTPGISRDIYWTAGRYSQEGKAQWEWATTKPYQQLVYKNWYPINPVQPDFNEPGYCMDISFASPGYWFDTLCSNNIKFICESN